jgi:hypothetical protein
MEKFVINTPLSGEYFTTVRLTTGGVCALAGFDVDTAEDFKVCVTESLLILKRNGYSSADVTFTVGETLACEIAGKGDGVAEESGLEDEISRSLLSALLGKVEFVDENGKIEKIVFEG